MADGWHERFDAARAEYAEAQVEYKLAVSAMARAISRRNDAERVLNGIYRQRAEQINGDVGGPTK